MIITYHNKLTGNAAEDALKMVELYHIPAYKVAHIIKDIRPESFDVYTDANQRIIHAEKGQYVIDRSMIIPVEILKAL